jgi:pimeloyl-ACP methyl ester carboxylesterase
MTNEREAVLFVHSTGTGPGLWKRVPPAILGERRILTPSNIGYAPGPLLERGAAFVAADDAQHVLAAIPDDVEGLHLVAHSYGALVGLLLMQEPAFASRLRSAFLYEPVPFGALLHPSADSVADPEGIAEARGFVTERWFLEDEERGGRAEWLELFVDYWNRPGSWAQMPEFIREETLALGWKMFQEVRSCFGMQTPFAGWTFPAQAPATVAHGEHSPKASRAMAKALGSVHPNVVVRELPKVGHMAPLTHPPAVHAAIADHLAGLPGRRK